MAQEVLDLVQAREDVRLRLVVGGLARGESCLLRGWGGAGVQPASGMHSSCSCEPVEGRACPHGDRHANALPPPLQKRRRQATGSRLYIIRVHAQVPAPTL